MCLSNCFNAIGKDLALKTLYAKYSLVAHEARQAGYNKRIEPNTDIPFCRMNKLCVPDSTHCLISQHEDYQHLTA